MNAVEIEAAISDLAFQPFDAAEFPFRLHHGLHPSAPHEERESTVLQASMHIRRITLEQRRLRIGRQD
jgi:hypothetical protein